jgi:hypothetical protein
MKPVSHYDKVMWGLYCEYSYIPQDVWYTREPIHERVWNEEKERSFYIFQGRYREERHTKRSAAQWSFIHSKYYYITKVDPIYTGSKQDFVNYLEYRTAWRNGHRRSPYDYKKNGYQRD